MAVGNATRPAVTVDPTGSVTGDPKPYRRHLVPILMVVGLLLHAAWRLWLASPLSTPVVLGDESRYLVFARVLAGGPGGYGGDTEATRRVGYALLVSPVYWFSSDPFTVHRLVQVLNALINIMTFPLAYLFARRVLGAPQLWALGVGFVAALLPAVTFFAAFTLPNAVLTPLLLAWLLTLHRWMTAESDRVKIWSAAASGAVIGYMYVIHVRALLLLGVYALVVVGLFVTKRSRLADTLAASGAVVVALALHPILKSLLSGKVITGGSEPESRMWSAFTTVDGIVRTVSGAAGQIWYISVSTWGIGAVGLVVAGYYLVRRRGYEWPTAVVLAVCMVSTLLIAVITSAALPDDGKVNNHIYPGYVIFLAPIWVMVGLTALRDASRRQVLAVAAGAGGLLLVSWFVVESYSRPFGVIGRPGIFSPIDAPEPLFLGGDWDVVHLARVTLIVLGIIAAGVAVTVFRPRTTLAAGAFILLVATVLNVAAMGQTRTVMTSLAVEQAGPELVKTGGVKPGDTVVCDKNVIARYNHQREVYWAALPFVDLSLEAPPAGTDFVVSRYYTGVKEVDWDGGAYGYRLVTGDPRNHWALWRRQDPSSLA